jgi:hypothetical protein
MKPKPSRRQHTIFNHETIPAFHPSTRDILPPFPNSLTILIIMLGGISRPIRKLLAF